MSSKIINVAASVKARLMNIARARQTTLNTILIRYANERFLYRLSVSKYRDDFILKGSNLFLIWQNGYPYRPTIDSDFLVLGRADQMYLKSVFVELCAMQLVEADGLTFDASTVSAMDIREKAQYGGTRIRLAGLLGSVKVFLQFDIGVGDAVTPAPEISTYPVVLDFAAPVLRTYPRETVIAEKVKTMVTLGIANSRMKDFADILILQRNFVFDYSVLRTALIRTFARYEVVLPTEEPVCFQDEFFKSPSKQKQWSAFCNKAEISDLPHDFSVAGAEIRAFLVPLLFLSPAKLQSWSKADGWK